MQRCLFFVFMFAWCLFACCLCLFVSICLIGLFLCFSCSSCICLLLHEQACKYVLYFSNHMLKIIFVNMVFCPSTIYTPLVVAQTSIIPIVEVWPKTQPFLCSNVSCCKIFWCREDDNNFDLVLIDVNIWWFLMDSCSGLVVNLWWEAFVASFWKLYRCWELLS